MSTQTELRAVLHQDFNAFVERSFQTVTGAQLERNWHIDAISYHLARCVTGDLRRLLISMPPRNLKSICASVALPAWILGRDPRKQVVCASYSQDLDNDLAGRERLVMKTDWYRNTFPALATLRDTEAEYQTTQGGSRYATSVGGTLTGRGADFLIIDDPMKPDERLSKTARDGVINWYRSTASTRLNDKRTGVVIVVMQRLHEDDLVGQLLRDGDWEHLCLPAIAAEDLLVPWGPNEQHRMRSGELLHPSREPQQILDALQRSMGSANFSAQYLQKPAPDGGYLVKREWLKTYLSAPQPSRIVQSWDTAMKGNAGTDFSVCTTWFEAGEGYFLVDVYRERLEYPALRTAALRLHERFSPNAVLIEDKGSGTALIQELRQQRGISAIAIEPEGDKTSRFDVQSTKFEAGKVHVPNDAPWLPVFLEELLAFPGSRHDDQIDSVSQFLKWTDQRPHGRFDVYWDRPDPVLGAVMGYLHPPWR